MKTTIISILSLCCIILSADQLSAQEGKWKSFTKDSIYSNLDNNKQYFYYYKSSSSDKKPLLVSLHQWGANYEEYNNSLAPQAKELDWNYVHPDFRGANKHIKACGSDYVISDIDDVIDWALKNFSVDKSQIYVVGASGGGYAALCSFMKSKHDIKEYSVWVPISDLKRWYYESKSRKSHYAKNIINCTCDGCDKLDEDKAIERSPLYWSTPVKKLNNTKLNIYAGVHDGYTGAVPIIHSINFYNKVVSDIGGTDTDKVSDSDAIWMLTTRTSPNNDNKQIGPRKLLYNKSFKNVSITIFEGGHEILVNEILKNQ